MDAVAAIEPAPETARPRRRWLRNTGFMIGAGIVVFFVLIAIFADWLAPHDPYSQSLLRRLRPPVWSEGGSWTYPLGTDAFGRDYLSRLIYGTRISLAVGLGAAAIAGLIGATLGIFAGYLGGWVDRVVSFVIATRLALPALLIALAVLQVGGSGLGIVILVLGLTHWDRFAVVLRTATMQVRNQDYVTRARLIGSSDLAVVLREIFPNVLGAFVVIFTFEMAQTILAAAALSFLGLGIRAPEPSWGLMMAEGRNYMTSNPWLISGAGLALMLMVLAVNLLGDGLRDMLAREDRR